MDTGKISDLLTTSEEWRNGMGFTAPLPSMVDGGQLSLEEEVAAAMLYEGEELEQWKKDLQIDEWAVDAGESAGEDRLACFYLCVFLGLCSGLMKVENEGWAEIFQQVQDGELDLSLTQFKAMFDFPVRKRAGDADVRKMAEGLELHIIVMDPMETREFGSEGEKMVLFLWGGHYRLAVPPKDGGRQKVLKFLESERWKELRDGGLHAEN